MTFQLLLFSYVGGIWNLIKNELEELKKELDLLIGKEASKEEIYNMSVKIDKKIMEYYKEYELGCISK